MLESTLHRACLRVLYVDRFIYLRQMMKSTGNMDAAVRVFPVAEIAEITAKVISNFASYTSLTLQQSCSRNPGQRDTPKNCAI